MMSPQDRTLDASGLPTTCRDSAVAEHARTVASRPGPTGGPKATFSRIRPRAWTLSPEAALAKIALQSATASAQPACVIAMPQLSQAFTPVSLVETTPHPSSEFSYDGLLDLGPKGKRPALAERCEISRDVKRIGAFTRHGVEFHNGFLDELPQVPDVSAEAPARLAEAGIKLGHKLGFTVPKESFAVVRNAPRALEAIAGNFEAADFMVERRSIDDAARPAMTRGGEPTGVVHAPSPLPGERGESINSHSTPGESGRSSRRSATDTTRA